MEQIQCRHGCPSPDSREGLRGRPGGSGFSERRRALQGPVGERVKEGNALDAVQPEPSGPALARHERPETGAAEPAPAAAYFRTIDIGSTFDARPDGFR